MDISVTRFDEILKDLDNYLRAYFVWAKFGTLFNNVVDAIGQSFIVDSGQSLKPNIGHLVTLFDINRLLGGGGQGLALKC